jgi:hypothetical protein
LDGSPRSGDFDVDGELDDGSVGGMVIGSEWSCCDPGSSGGMDAIVGVLAKWLGGPVGEGLAEYQGSLCC